MRNDNPISSFNRSTVDPSSILICDDSIEELRILVSMLKNSHYKLSISSNGKDACSRAEILKPDIILMDVRMPIMDGFAACRILKANQDTRDIPLIFLTAANEVEDRLEGLKIGAVDYIVKPANAEEVLLRVGIHIKNKTQSNDEHKFTTSSSNSNKAVIEATCRLLNSHLSENPTINEIAEKVGCHRQKLTEAFKHEFGTTVFGWLRERRMQQATEWLKETQLPIEGMSQELGFITPGNFSTAFKSRFGMSPREYRKHMQESRPITKETTSKEIK